MTSCLVTTHAEERIMERFGCRKEKVFKVVKKAYYSKLAVKKTFVRQRMELRPQPGMFYRYFMGFIFVFRWEGFGMARLITIYKVKRSNNVLAKIPKKQV